MPAVELGLGLAPASLTRFISCLAAYPSQQKQMETEAEGRLLDTHEHSQKYLLPISPFGLLSNSSIHGFLLWKNPVLARRPLLTSGAIHFSGSPLKADLQTWLSNASTVLARLDVPG